MATNKDNPQIIECENEVFARYTVVQYLRMVAPDLLRWKTDEAAEVGG